MCSLRWISILFNIFWFFLKFEKMNRHVKKQKPQTSQCEFLEPRRKYLYKVYKVFNKGSTIIITLKYNLIRKWSEIMQNNENILIQLCF